MLQNIWLDSILIIVFIVLFVLAILLIRRKLFKLWHKVTRLEVTFHNTLKACVRLYLRYEDTIRPFDPGGQLERLRKYDGRNMRGLELEKRQAIHRSLQTLFVSLDETEVSGYPTLKSMFDTLQNKRLRYNSAVLYYNHLVMTFPIRYLANRFGFRTKEYFG